MTVANCKKCNRVFQRQHSPLCAACLEENSSLLSTAYRFIQANPQTLLEEVAAYCGTPYRELEALFLEGKLGTAAQQVLYRCQRCHTPMDAARRKAASAFAVREKWNTKRNCTRAVVRTLPQKRRPARAPPSLQTTRRPISRLSKLFWIVSLLRHARMGSRGPRAIRRPRLRSPREGC